MPVATRKRGHAGGGDGSPALLGHHGLGSYARPGPPCHSGGGGGSGSGGDDGEDCFRALLLDALGLRSFARLGLPAPPDGLDFTAKVDSKSGCITVSVGGDSIMASPADLAEALLLPLGTDPLAAENTDLFCSVEAITTLRVFVRDRLLLGGTEDGQVLPDEAIAALRLVEEGKAYAVDWGLLVWAFLRSDVMIGKRRRCSQYLLRLMKYQRPDLFSEVDGRLLGKRRKGLSPQQRQRMNGQFVDCTETEVEEGSFFGLNNKIGEFEKMPAFGYVKDQQHKIATEDQEDDNDDNVNVGSSLPSFRASQGQILAQLSYMENAILDGERTLAHTLAEMHQMRENEKEKNNQINSIGEETYKELKARAIKLKQLEYEKMVMFNTFCGYKKQFEKSYAEFLEYRKIMCPGSAVSSLDDVAHRKNQVRLIQQQRRAYEIINGFQKPLLSNFSACAKKITVLLKKLADLNNDVQRLKDSRPVIDLNVGPHL
ncbi:unnamed protein product [Alopecurus aequalis]